MFWSSLVLSLLAVPACLAAPSFEKRGTTGATLYAYGQNISGLPIVADVTTGALFTAAANSSTLTSIIWNIGSLSSTADATANASTTNGTAVGSLYINPANTMFEKSMLVGGSTNNTAETGTPGFATYGKQLVYYNGTSIQSAFWALENGGHHIDGQPTYAIYWNSDNVDQAPAVPVVLKTIAPSL